VFVALEPGTLAELQTLIPELGSSSEGPSSLQYPIVLGESVDWDRYVAKYSTSRMQGGVYSDALGIAIIDQEGYFYAIKGYPGSTTSADYQRSAEVAWLSEKVDELLAASTVQGCVYLRDKGNNQGPPQAGTILTFTRSDNQVSSSVTVDDAGCYRAALAPGSYRVAVSDDDGQDWRAVPQVLELASGVQRTFPIYVLGNIRLYVHEQDLAVGSPGTPVVDASLYLFKPDGKLLSEEATMSDGSWWDVLRELPEDQGYAVHITHPDYADQSSPPGFLAINDEYNPYDFPLRKMVGAQALFRSWKIAWQDGAPVTTGATTSVQDYPGKVVVLAFTRQC